MKVYIACPFAQRLRAEGLANQLEQSGHTITYKWWTTAPEHGGKPAEAHTTAELRRIGQVEIDAVCEADVVMAIFPHPSIGTLMECGMAVALARPLVVFADEGAPLDAWALVPFAHLPRVLVTTPGATSPIELLKTLRVTGWSFERLVNELESHLAREAP